MGKIRSTATAEGTAIYDAKERRLASFLLVLSGEYLHLEDPPQRIAAVAEWRGD